MGNNSYGFHPSGLRRLETEPRRISDSGFGEPLAHEICDECLEECKQQAVKFCEEVLATLEQLSRSRGLSDSWIDDIPFPDKAKAVLRSLRGNVGEIGRLREAFESLTSEMLQKGKSEAGGKRTNYFAYSPFKSDMILFITSLAPKPLENWLGGKLLMVDGREFALAVRSYTSSENALLTQGEPPIAVNAKGKRV